jgi:glucose dehydrogenase
MIAIGALAGTTASAAPSAPGSWPYSNGNLANTRVAAGSTITLANVSQLKEIWSFQLKGKAAKSDAGTGTLAANPIVVNGVVYMQDLRCDVFALSLSTGRLMWEYVVNKREVSGPGPNGVAVADGTVYGQTPYAAFALSAATGKQLWKDNHLLSGERAGVSREPVRIGSGRRRAHGPR